MRTLSGCRLALVTVVIACSWTSVQAADPGVFAPKAIEEWSDAVFGKAVAEYRVSGLGIAVTQDDKVVFQKG